VSDPFDARFSGIGTGGTLAADFVNTLDWRLGKEPRDCLGSYAELVRFSWSAGVLTGSEARSLLDWAKTHPRSAARELGHAIRLREAIALLFAAVRDGTRLPALPLGVLDAACRRAASDRSLRPAGRFATWVRNPGSPPPQRPAWAAAEDAARLLTSPDRERLCQCGDAECGWFFLDTSRNRSRRWCSMESCGNRNKARSFYRRARAHPMKPS
jgi:predicted RNA-binding Zn ribbon-like protein